jgi:catecholate siderophore receptor
MLEPERFTNREVGAKWDALPGLALTGALFRLDRTNTSAPDPCRPAKVVQTGAQRTTGWEMGLSGEVTPAWQVAGGWSAQRGDDREPHVGRGAGATVPLVPHRTLSLWNR